MLLINERKVTEKNGVLKSIFNGTVKEKSIPKGTIPLFDGKESYAQWKVFAKNGPEFHFHIGKDDCKKIVSAINSNPNSPEVLEFEEQLADSIEKMGISKDKLNSALDSIGFSNYKEFAEVIFKIAVEAYEKANQIDNKGKKIINDDGSMDIRQPLLFLIRKDRWIGFGDEWFKFPVKVEKVVTTEPKTTDDTPKVIETQELEKTDIHDNNNNNAIEKKLETNTNEKQLTKTPETIINSTLSSHSLENELENEKQIPTHHEFHFSRKIK